MGAGRTEMGSWANRNGELGDHGICFSFGAFLQGLRQVLFQSACSFLFFFSTRIANLALFSFSTQNCQPSYFKNQPLLFFSFFSPVCR